MLHELHHGIEPLLVKLGIGQEEAQIVRSSPWRTRNLHKGEYLEREGGTPESVFVLCSGIAFASKQLADGALQNVALFFAGDMLNYDSYMANYSNVSVTAVTVACAMQLPHADFTVLLDHHPGVRRAFLRDIARANMIAHEWLLGQGRRSAYVRIAHLLCEIFYRLDRIEQSSNDECVLPLSQSELADTAGLSLVHLNRTLQQLRSASLIEFKSGRLRILDMEGLRSVASFDPAYLGM